MQEVGRAWLMTELTPVPLLVALVQSAAMAALVLLMLPAGVVADVADKRRVLIAAQVWMMAGSVALGLATLARAIGPAAQQSAVSTRYLRCQSALGRQCAHH